MRKTALGGLFASGLFLTLAQSAGSQPNAPLIEFNYGFPTADYITLYVAQDLGLFEKAGLKPKFFTFQSGAPLLAGLKSESLDVVTTGLATMFALGQGIPLKFLFWEVDDAAGEGFVADPKSGIQSFKDIGKAKKIAAPSGTCAQISLSLLAKKAGVDFSKLNVVNIAPPLYNNAFVSGSIDAGMAWAPYSMALNAAGYPVVNWDEEYVPDGGICPVLTAIRPSFLEKNPSVALKLVEVHALAAEALAKDPQLGVYALSKHLGISEAVAKANYERSCCGRKPTLDQQVDPNSQYSLTSKDGGLAKKLFVAGQILHEVGSIPNEIPMKTIQDAIDPSYVQQYVKSHADHK